MKKLFLMMGLACLFMVACDNAPQQEQPKDEPKQEANVQEEHKCPFCALKAEYANWETMADSAKVALNAKALELFTQMDAEMEAKKAEMEAKGECVKEKAEEVKAECEAKCVEMKAKCEEMKAAWEKFAELGVDEQKDLVLGRIEAMGMGKCDHAEGEEHKCCEQKGEEHKCDQAK